MNELIADHDIFKFLDDVYLATDETNQSSKLVKLDDDNFYFQATLVASEVICEIDGQKSVSEIVQKVSEQYDQDHYEEIRQGAIELLTKLLSENLVVRV